MSNPPVPAAAPLRILLVEDQRILRETLSEWIGSHAGWQLVGACSTLAEARTQLLSRTVDVVVVDVGLPDGSGLALVRGGTAVVLLTANEQPWLLREMAEAPVLGIVMKGSPLADLERAITLAAEGEASTCRRTSELLRKAATRDDPLRRLTARELEVLRLVVEGQTSREIAETLAIAEKTVQNHRANLMDKLDIHDVAGLVRYAIDQGLHPR